jgi:hypothetical protein
MGVLRSARQLRVAMAKTKAEGARALIGKTVYLIRSWAPRYAAKVADPATPLVVRDYYPGFYVVELTATGERFDVKSCALSELDPEAQAALVASRQGMFR